MSIIAAIAYVAQAVNPIGLSQYIVGGWVVGPSCQTDTGEVFTRTGKYLTLEETGRWRSNGSEIIIYTNGPTYRYRIRPINKDRALFRDQDGNEWFARRCILHNNTE
jgi:hypothetical protein